MLTTGKLSMPREELRGYVRKRLKADKKPATIAKELGVSYNYLYRRLRMYGMFFRPELIDPIESQEAAR